MTHDTMKKEKIWGATCGVDGSRWIATMIDDTPPKGGSFCPDCQKRRMIAPGVLHWKFKERGIMKDKP